MINVKRIVFIVIGPVLFALCCLLLPQTVFPALAARAAVGTVAWMAFWWVTAPVDYAVTAFLPIAVNALVPMTEMSDVISNYASETIMLLLGASILTVSWEITGLDARIAARFLSMVGNSFRKQVAFWFILSAAMSAILPNAVVCATITPIAVAMLKYIGENDIKKSKIGSKLLLTIVYAAGVGGLATPLGGAMNLVIVDYLQQVTGKEYMYGSWLIRFLPIMIVLVIVNILFMIRDIGKNESLGGSKEYFVRKYQEMPKMSFEEKASLILFLIAVILAFTRQLYQDLLPGLKPAYVFIICAILSFFVTSKDGQRLMNWGSVQKKIVWEMIYIFAGGLAAGTLINNSGAAEQLGNFVAGIGLTGGLFTVFIILFVPLILSDITSNTATAAVIIPIVISIMQGMGKNAIPYMYVATVGVNLSYMLPTSIRAIPVGYGLEPKYMLKEGWKITVIVTILMTLECYLLYRFWPAFSTC